MSGFVNERRLGWWRLLTTGLLVAIVAGLVVGASLDDPTHKLAWDFRGAYLPAAHAIVHGQSPYSTPDTTHAVRCAVITQF